MTRNDLVKRAGARFRSTLGRSELLAPFVDRGKHLNMAASMAEERFKKHHASISSEVHGLDAQIRERKAALSELKSAGEGGASGFARGNISGLEKEVAKLTAKRQSLVGKLENSYNFMHKHHLNAASHAKAPGAMADLSAHRAALDELKAGPRGGLKHFLKKWKLPLAGGALAVGGVMAIKHLRNRRSPAEMGAVPPEQVT